MIMSHRLRPWAGALLFCLLFIVARAADQGPIFLPMVPQASPVVIGPHPTVIPAPTPVARAQDTVGRSTLHAWPEFVAREQLGMPTTASFVMIGDSWTSRDLISGPLRRMLQDSYGDAGIGYVGIGANHGVPAATGVLYRRIGLWTDRDKTPDAYGLDLASATTSDPAASVTIDAPATDFILHYMRQAGGGSFRVQVDNGEEQIIQTEAAISSYTTLRVGPFADGPHHLKISLDSAEGTGVTLFGADVQRNGTGVRVHRIGSGSATTQMYASQDHRFTIGALAALNPALVLIMLGTNDMAISMEPSQFYSNLVAIVHRVRDEAPDADIVLATPADNAIITGLYGMATYVATTRQVAEDEQIAFLDVYANFGPYDRGERHGLYADMSHPSLLGGQVIANLIYNRLLRVK